VKYPRVVIVRDRVSSKSSSSEESFNVTNDATIAAVPRPFSQLCNTIIYIIILNDRLSVIMNTIADEHTIVFSCYHLLGRFE